MFRSKLRRRKAPRRAAGDCDSTELISIFPVNAKLVSSRTVAVAVLFYLVILAPMLSIIIIMIKSLVRT